MQEGQDALGCLDQRFYGRAPNEREVVGREGELDPKAVRLEAHQRSGRLRLAAGVENALDAPAPRLDLAGAEEGIGDVWIEGMRIVRCQERGLCPAVWQEAPALPRRSPEEVGGLEYCREGRRLAAWSVPEWPAGSTPGAYGEEAEWHSNRARHRPCSELRVTKQCSKRLAPHPFSLAPRPFSLTPRPFSLAPRPFSLAPRPFPLAPSLRSHRVASPPRDGPWPARQAP